MRTFTDEQLSAINAKGKTIVSASAGSGKTAVMIEKLVQAVLNGVDLDEILAMTFTNKAAAQMKDRLRAGLIERLDFADEGERAKIKLQLSKISTSDICTIHSFCAKTLRTYFYLADVDSGFEIISSDDSKASELKARALETLFDAAYAEDNEEFLLLLDCFTRKRNDLHLRELLCEAHSKVRGIADYDKLLQRAESIYTEDGFLAVCQELKGIYAQKYEDLYDEVVKFSNNFHVSAGQEKYDKIFSEMKESLLFCMNSGLFEEKPALCKTSRPTAKEECDKAAADSYSDFRTALNKAYNAVKSGLSSEAEERQNFFESGKIVCAFCHLLLQFDAEYAAIKRDENKLDYNDLEHMTLKLLSEHGADVAGRYSYVFVDEYQDVNPVQECIIAAVTADCDSFCVGDKKQAIYGFRGSKSKYFDEKREKLRQGGNDIELSANFRSSGKVIEFVNSVFREIIPDYTPMVAKGAYPPDYGKVQFHVFNSKKMRDSKKSDAQDKERGIYSVEDDSRENIYTFEGRAVVDVVNNLLTSERFDAKSGGFVPVQAGDICILTRKRQDSSALGIAKALTDAGYSVSGAKESNICNRPEVRNMLDILSFLDDGLQDIPLTTTMLSPIGNFTDDELARIRYTAQFEKGDGDTSFLRCCRQCIERGDELSQKLSSFFEKIESLRDMCEILSAGEVIDKILCDTGFDAAYCSGGGEKLKNVLRLAEEGEDLSVSAFLRKIKTGGNNIPAPSSAETDSIKIMTMHSAKGLEFPIVIIADICKTFEGRDLREMPFDEDFLFAPKRYDVKNALTSETILRRLNKIKQDREDFANEINLFYVACTRAECELHIMARDDETYPEYPAVTTINSYAKMFDMQRYSRQYMPELPVVSPRGKALPPISDPDEKDVEKLEKVFARKYDFYESVDLPVKSSASAILRMQKELEEKPAVTHELFRDKEERTGVDVGTAYHRFLQLCDFEKNSGEDIEKQLKKFYEQGQISEGQLKLLDVQKLQSILTMPVFRHIKGATLYREQEFLCYMQADEFLDTKARDNLLVQGAIDLLGIGENGVFIIDYKYSGRGDNELKNAYAKQLSLYKKAAARILKVGEEKISTTIVNICLCRQIDMD